VLHRALGAVGLTAPRSTASALFWLILYRLRLSLWFLFGLRFKERAPNDVGREARSRVDAAHAAAVGFAVTDVILGTCMSAWSLILALREGDRFQMMRAAMLQASNHAGMGGVERGFEGALIKISARLAEKEADLDGEAFFRGTRGIGSYLRGRWKEALETLDSSISGVQIHSHKAGWQSNSNVFGCWALNFLGEHRELARRHARLLADAEQRGDMYTSVQLRDGSLAIVWLVADDPDSARRNAHEAIALWPKNRYLLQHWHMLYGEGEIELYLGRGAEAYARVERDASALKKSFLLTVQHMRAQTTFLRGRSAIASIDTAPALRSERVAEARRLSHALEKERMGWTAPLAAILKAGAANAEGDRSGAVSSLRSAIDLARAADMSMYASAARYQLGLLLGGEEGRELVRQAHEAMTAQDVRRPDRLAATLVPGRWLAE
jgi:hypothetical protein